MSYRGRELTAGNYLKLDDLQSQFNSSTTTFNLTSGGTAFYPGSAFSIQVVLGGVIQEPESAYTINQSQITFAAAPGSGDDFFCIALGVSLGIGVPGEGTVTGTKLSKPFSYDDGLLVLDSTNNFIGVNSTTPTVALDVIGSVKVVGNIIQTSGLVGIGTTNPLQRFQIGVANTVGVSTDGKVFVVTGIGSVGIGTTNPTSKLHVVGDTRLERIAISTTSTNLTMEPGYSYAYYVGVTSMTLPALPVMGNTLRIINRSGITTAIILRNGSNIMGVADDVLFDEVNGTYNFTYVNTTDGWIISR